MSQQETETPVLDLLARMNTDAIETTTLDPEQAMLVRIAALVAVTREGEHPLRRSSSRSDAVFGEDDFLARATERSSPGPWPP